MFLASQRDSRLGALALKCFCLEVTPVTPTPILLAKGGYMAVVYLKFSVKYNLFMDLDGEETKNTGEQCSLLLQYVY